MSSMSIALARKTYFIFQENEICFSCQCYTHSYFKLHSRQITDADIQLTYGFYFE